MTVYSRALGIFVVTLFAVVGTTGTAVAQESVPCTSDADCDEGQFCAILPCTATDCPPDDPDCKPSEDCPEEGMCASEGGGEDGPWGESDCTTDDDCPAGFSCDEIGSIGSGCVCPPDDPDCDCGEPTETTFYGCMPADCTMDAECTDGLVCVTWEVPCDVPPTACPPGEECDEPSDPPDGDCESKTVGKCLPKWAAPCESATDCGDGFTCDPVVSCECSGSEPTEPIEPPPIPPPAEPEDEPTDPDCTCEETGENQCVPEEIACVTDDECPDGWLCTEAGTGTCTSTPDGEEDCEDVEGGKLCMPPYADYVGDFVDLDPDGEDEPGGTEVPDPIEPTDATDATDGTEGPDATGSTDATDKPDPTETTDATESTEVTDATESTDATDATESTDATDATDATESTDATDSTDATGATDGTDATDSTDGSTPPSDTESDSGGCQAGGAGGGLLPTVLALVLIIGLRRREESLAS